MGTAGSIREQRQELHDQLTEARARTDALFELLEPGALVERPIPERHRVVFYLGHLEAFDWNLLAGTTFGLEPFSPKLDRLFAFGIDPTDGGLPDDPPSAWPPEREVRAYNQRVRETVDRLLRDADFTDSKRPGLAGGQVFHVAIEHRLMHAETLAYMLHRLPYERKRPQADPPAPAVRGNGARRASIPAGSATLGLTPGDPRVFGWDNEFELHAVQVPAFSIDTRKVTNGEFLEFLTRGGYQERRLWSDPDWAWKEQEGIRHPSFWRKAADGQWLYHGMFSEFPLPIDWPAYVSHAEASAFARWRGGALPTEAQFHRAAYGTPSGPERDYPWGAEPPAPKHGNFDFLRWDPAPVGAYPLGDSAFGVSDLIGNGWEWTSSRFEPFPGFKAFPFYPGYSANFFDGKHYVMKGGSPRTAACTLRRSFRNWFQPHYPYVYAGFRLVEG